MAIVKAKFAPGGLTLAQAQASAQAALTAKGEAIAEKGKILDAAKAIKEVGERVVPSRAKTSGTRSGGLDYDLFAEALDKFGDEVNEWQIQMARDFGKAVLTGVVEKTPVFTGRAQGNWQVSRDAPSETAVPFPLFLESPINKGYAVLNRMKKFQDAYICNNVAYITDLENGWSQQAPQGMVAVTLAEVSSLMGGYVDALDKAVSLSDEDMRGKF